MWSLNIKEKKKERQTANFISKPFRQETLRNLGNELQLTCLTNNSHGIYKVSLFVPSFTGRAAGEFCSIATGAAETPGW